MLDLQQRPAHSFLMTEFSPSPSGRLRLRTLQKPWATLAALVLICFSACDRSEVDLVDGAGIPTVAYGTKITFGQNGNAERLKDSGWSKTEEKFTWSEGTTSVLRMRIPATNDSIRLKMKMAALVREPELPFQPVEVEANGQKIADWQVGDTADFVAPIPHDIAKKGGELAITFRVPKATSPKALGLNADPRILGICCHVLELTDR